MCCFFFVKGCPRNWENPILIQFVLLNTCGRVVFIGITFTMLIADEQLSEYNLNRTFDAYVCFISFITTHVKYWNAVSFQWEANQSLSKFSQGFLLSKFKIIFWKELSLQSIWIKNDFVVSGRRRLYELKLINEIMRGCCWILQIIFLVLFYIHTYVPLYIQIVLLQTFPTIWRTFRRLVTFVNKVNNEQLGNSQICGIRCLAVWHTRGKLLSKSWVLSSASADIIGQFTLIYCQYQINLKACYMGPLGIKGTYFDWKV